MEEHNKENVGREQKDLVKVLYFSTVYIFELSKIIQPIRPDVSEVLLEQAKTLVDDLSSMVISESDKEEIKKYEEMIKKNAE